MSAYYQEFLQRMVRYRQQLNLTQEKMGQELGITQSQFSKHELGKTIVSYKMLVTFAGMGWDMDYLFTGKKTAPKSPVLSERIKGLEASKRSAMIRLVAWALETALVRDDKEEDTELKCELCILKNRAEAENTDSILYQLREISDMSQFAMAEMLGVNIKKYRMLERTQIYPDAELLLEIYRTTGCRPSLFLIHYDVENVIMDNLWSVLPGERKQKLLTLIDKAEEFLGA